MPPGANHGVCSAPRIGPPCTSAPRTAATRDALRTTRRYGTVGAWLLASCGTLGAPGVTTPPPGAPILWHVAATGDDGAPGTEAAPWKTIQHAADRVNPGETVIVHVGTYAGFRVGAAGTQAAPIAFIADGVVTIDGASTTDQDAIHVEGASWIQIEGFSVTRARRAGISAIDCDHITVRNNHVDSSGTWGVFSGFCEYLTIEGNEASRSVRQHGIYASNSADHAVIRGNKVWGNPMCGIQINGDATQGGDGVISDAVVESNVIYDNGKLGGAAINCDGVRDAVIWNNVIDGNHRSGISLYRIDGGAPSTRNRVVNNTIRMADDARFAIKIEDGSTGNTLRNNILLAAAPGQVAIEICAACVTGLGSDHNAVSDAFSIDGEVLTLAGWRPRTGQDASSSVATAGALFADDTLAPAAGSPAIDRGDTAAAPAIDILGTPRPQGTAADLGAYERCEATCARSAAR